MTTGELLDMLKAVIENHPEAADAAVWAYDDTHSHKFPVKAVGFDRRHKPHRVKME